MKPLWIGTMAITFVLGTGMIALIYILWKMAFSYAKRILRTEPVLVCVDG